MSAKVVMMYEPARDAGSEELRRFIRDEFCDHCRTHFKSYWDANPHLSLWEVVEAFDIRAMARDFDRNIRQEWNNS